jgi:lysophospholipase L1-like esterase
MPRPTTRLLRRAALAAAGFLAAGSLALPGIASAHPAHHPGHHHPPGVGPVVAGSDYLALGDSVSFGYREPDTTPAPVYADQAQFVGFPEQVAAALGLHVANLSCPGETSASLINPAAPSNGCENSYVGGKQQPGGYRTHYPLHEQYRGSQLAAGVRYLRSHPDTRLVTLMIGANDGFLCQAETADHCTSPTELAAVAKHIAVNVGRILYTLRVTAHYRGQIVLVQYYSTDYAVPLDNQQSELLNAAMEAGARPFHVEVAPTFAAFEAASTYSANDPCTAGLLTQLTSGGKPTGSCGVHPSPAGQDVLAQTVEATVVK